MIRVPTLLLLALASLPLLAEVHYGEPRTGAHAAPGGEIAAVEVRVAAPDCRPHRSGSWTLSWPGAKVAFSADLKHFIDGSDEPEARIAVNGHSATISSGIDLSGDFNSLAIQWLQDGDAIVSVGSKGLAEVLKIGNLTRPTDSISLEGNVKVADVIFETDDDALSRLLTDWDGIFPENPDAMTGRWRYLDREADPALSRLGGRYQLAILPSSTGAYDIIYLGGAETMASDWRPGMLKGRLLPQGFSGYYRLEWRDAAGRDCGADNYAEMSADGKVISLIFPALSCTLRLAKQPF